MCRSALQTFIAILGKYIQAIFRTLYLDILGKGLWKKNSIQKNTLSPSNILSVSSVSGFSNMEVNKAEYVRDIY